jgi:hypothetical protein
MIAPEKASPYRVRLLKIFPQAIWGIGIAFLMPSLMVYALEHAGSSPGPAMGPFTAISDLRQMP